MVGMFEHVEAMLPEEFSRHQVLKEAERVRHRAHSKRRKKKRAAEKAAKIQVSKK